MEEKLRLEKYQNLEKLFESEISAGFLEYVIPKFPEVYKSTYDYVFDNFKPAQAKDLLPHYRRAKIEELLLEAANKFDKTDSIVHLNKAKNSRHVRIKAKSIVFTANAVNGPWEMVRRASFRDTLAEGNQPVLFPELNPGLRGDSCYAMLLHGPEMLDPSRISFLRFAFPSYDCKNYLENINLPKYYEIELYPVAGLEEVRDRVVVEFKANLKQEGEE